MNMPALSLSLPRPWRALLGVTTAALLVAGTTPPSVRADGLPPLPPPRAMANFIEVPTPANPTDDELLDVVEHKAFAYFWNETDPNTGLTKDHGRNVGAAPDAFTRASIASAGYALAALPIGVERHWIDKQLAYDRALSSLKFLYNTMPQEHGFYFHFVDWNTGQRAKTTELSSIDTALLALGALTAGQYWKGTEVDRLANALYERIDFPWMQRADGSSPEKKTLSHGWKPETGWLKSRWDSYNEAAYLYIIAMGSPTKPVGPDAWDQWKVPTATCEGYEVFRGPTPAFMAQMAPGYLDFRGLRDRQGRDWWANFRNAHLANHAYCARNPNHSRTYSDTIWGITACQQPHGYKAQQPADGKNDGTVAPTASISSIFVTPELARPALRSLWTQYRGKIWGRYGFSNAFNVDQDWYDPDVLGLDLGMMLLDVENSRSGLIWKLTSQIPAIQKGMQAAGMHK